MPFHLSQQAFDGTFHCLVPVPPCFRLIGYPNSINQMSIAIKVIAQQSGTSLTSWVSKASPPAERQNGSPAEYNSKYDHRTILQWSTLINGNVHSIRGLTCKVLATEGKAS